jgi:hypothetical protein
MFGFVFSSMLHRNPWGFRLAAPGLALCRGLLDATHDLPGGGASNARALDVDPDLPPRVAPPRFGGAPVEASDHQI